MATGDYAPRIGGVRPEGPDRRIRHCWQIQRLPALAAILRALDRPCGAHGAVAGGDEQRFRIVHLLRKAAAVAQMETAADPEPLPALAAVVALEDLVRCGRQHSGAAVDDDSDVVDVEIGDAAGDSLPTIAAIGAAPDAVHLDPGPDHAIISRIDAQRSDPWHPNIWAFLGHLRRQFLPAAPAVLGAEQRRRPGASEDDVGIGGINGDLPDVQFVHRRFESLEALPAIRALVDPIICAREHDARLLRMHGEPEDLALAPQAFHARRQLSPPSRLVHNPLPIVPTQIVQLLDMADSSRSRRRLGSWPWFDESLKLPPPQRQGQGP